MDMLYFGEEGNEEIAAIFEDIQFRQLPSAKRQQLPSIHDFLGYEGNQDCFGGDFPIMN